MKINKLLTKRVIFIMCIASRKFIKYMITKEILNFVSNIRKLTDFFQTKARFSLTYYKVQYQVSRYDQRVREASSRHRIQQDPISICNRTISVNEKN